jgi:hypothetical protein
VSGRVGTADPAGLIYPSSAGRRFSGPALGCSPDCARLQATHTFEVVNPGGDESKKIGDAILQEARHGASILELRAAAAAVAPRVTASDVDSIVVELASAQLMRARRGGRWWTTATGLERLGA